jgi:PKD repeat protein
LSNANAAKINFYAKWALEADFDYVQFQVSTDGGTTWIGQCGNYTNAGTSANGSVQPNNQPVYDGTMSSWVLEEINLSDYLGQVIKVRFQLKSDGGTNMDGFYFDDFKIYFNIQAPAVTPTAQFGINNAVVCSGTTANFTDSSLDNPTAWAWDFGDGSTATTQNASHVFATAGTYTVTLTVSNSAGSNSTTQTIVVNGAPTLTITTSDTDGVVCLDAGLITLASDQLAAVFSGNGITGNNFDPQLAGVGPQTVTASYTDGIGCTGTTNTVIIVEDCASLTELSTYGVVVFPNPNQGSFTIKGLELESAFSVYDLNGKIIFEGIASSTTEQIQLPKITSGIYYLQSTKNGQIGQLKFAVLN